MTHVGSAIPEPATAQWQDEIDAERAGWRELVDLVRRLTPA